MANKYRKRNAAAEKFQFTLIGDKKLRRKLAKLEKKTADKAARKGIRAGLAVTAKAIRRAVRGAFQKKTGNLFKSIGSRFVKSKLIAKTGINVGKKKARQAPHAHLLLLGTKKRATKSGAGRGKIEGSDVVKQAHAQSKSAAMARMKGVTMKAIMDEAKRP